MLANYHTHTKRCHHAFGEDEEYVLTALKSGYSVLGFSDHAPYYYNGEYSSPDKMLPSEAPEYIRSILSLREKYQGKIEIHVGFEAEYYPTTFHKTLRLWQDVGAEYLILGQHFVGDEYPNHEGSKKPSDKNKLQRYVDCCIAAIETEKFSYFAHPDIINYTDNDDAFYEHEVRRLIECANKYEMPLEINLVGVAGGRKYPNPKFWEIAATMNPTAIIGADAHTPTFLENIDARKIAERIANDLGIRLIDRPEFKKV